jgi:hypothetical protein
MKDGRRRPYSTTVAGEMRRMTALLRRIGDALALLAGARPDLLAAAPGARARFVALGGVLLSTGGLALLSAAFAVHMALGANWFVAVLVGLFWGAVIVNLDRMLLVGMAHDASVRRNVALAVPRVGLGLVLGIVIATPLTLQVFHKEIDTEIVTLQAEAADAYKTGLADDARFAGLPRLQEKVATEQTIVASGGRNDPALATVHATLAAEQAAYQQAVETQQTLDARAQCEIDGTCGTGAAGGGAAYAGAKAAADAQSAVVAAAKARLDAATTAAEDAESRSLTLARSALATDEDELATLTAEQARLQAAFDATNEDNGGILIRLEALDRLGEKSTTLGLAHVMLSLLFMCIELLPVLMKVLLNFGPPSAYDRLSVLRDRSDLDVEEVQQQARREVEESLAELLVMAEKDRVERQKQDLLARRRAADLRFAERMRAQPVNAEPENTAEENGRRTWDTGPIVGLAREAAVRTVRTVTRRPGNRVPERV